MTSKLPEDVLVSLLRSAYRNARHDSPTRISTSPTSRRLSSLAAPSSLLHSSIRKQVACSRAGKNPRAQSRTLATTKQPNGKTWEIAVLGGGITGLTTAHYLSRHAKNAHITLYEASHDLGGWIDGKMINTGIGKNNKVLLQSGPRMLRSGATSYKYDDLVFYDVLINLGIQDKLLHHKGPPADRYLYYPDHLVKLPGSNRGLGAIFQMIESYLTEPLWDGALKSMINAALAGRMIVHDPTEYTDESVGDFLGRLMKDDRLVNNIVSGMMHGIYGGDVYKLSVMHTLFDAVWRRITHPTPSLHAIIEAKEAMLNLSILNSHNRFKVIELATKASFWGTMAFEDGLLTLSRSLIRDLKDQKNVTIKTNSPVTSLKHEDGKVSVAARNTANGGKRVQTRQYDRVISTLFSKHLAKLAEPKGCLPSLEDTHAVTIMVVNLWFPNPNLLAKNHGFGYLLPTSTPNNDECVLGVLFDSDIELRPETPGTKLTVMLGGHYWDGWTQYPTEEMGRAMALQAVQRHLGISPEEEHVSYAHLCRDCLPQHYVGHRERMSAAHYELEAAFQGQLTVAGPSYTSVGVMPSMRAGFEAAMRVARGTGAPWFRPKADSEDHVVQHVDSLKETFSDHIGETGLQGFTEPYHKTLVRVIRPSLMFKKWSNPIIFPPGWGEKQGR
ncbi:Protoporphyrinogen oxidase [Daldinia sp. FL1419]|nr:Protoporphyrinogen oxidase [Daldinia sp. FL1419]